MMKEIVWRGTADPDPSRAGSVTDPDSRRRRACFTTKRSHHQDSSTLLTDLNDYSIVRAFLDYQVRVSEHFIAMWVRTMRGRYASLVTPTAPEPPPTAPPRQAVGRECTSSHLDRHIWQGEVRRQLASQVCAGPPAVSPTSRDAARTTPQNCRHATCERGQRVSAMAYTKRRND
jgi:hypothetical protein